MKLIKEVCEESGLSHSILDNKGNLLSVRLGEKECFFTYTTTPFNREDVQHICNDKSLVQTLVSSKVQMPKTKKYLRPDLDPNWHDALEFSSEKDIAFDICNSFSFPLIIKMNAGSLGRNVFKSESRRGVEKAIATIFKEDWALLAQEWIDRKEEFRVIIVNNKVELVYPKGGGKFFTEGTDVFREVTDFLEPLQQCIELRWAGLDVIRDKNGKLWLIEINTRPSFISAIRCNQSELIKPLYKKALKNLHNLSSL